MRIIYKHFYSLSTVITTCLVFCVMASASFAQGNAQPDLSEALIPVTSDIFTVEEVVVDVTADNSVNARTQAFEKAQRDAFTILAKRLLSPSEAADFQTPQALAVSALIKDFEVTKEQLSAVRYVGTYTFRFKPADMRRYLSSRGSTYSDVKSKPVLILPFYEAQGAPALWDSSNVWLQAWSSVKLPGGLVPAVVPIGDISDVGDVDDGNGLQLDPLGLQTILGRYSAGEAVIVLAIPDPVFERQMKQGSQSAAGSLAVQIYRTDRGRSEVVKRFSVSARSSETVMAMLKRSVLTSYNSLQEDWKTKTAVDTRTVETFEITAHFQDLKSWAAMQSTLRRTAGVSALKVSSLSPQQARLLVTFQGDAERLKLALRQADLFLEGQPNQVASERPDFGGQDLNQVYGGYGYGTDRFVEQYRQSKGKNSRGAVVFDLYDKAGYQARPPGGFAPAVPPAFNPASAVPATAPSSSRSSRQNIAPFPSYRARRGVLTSPVLSPPGAVPVPNSRNVIQRSELPPPASPRTQHESPSDFQVTF